MSYLGGSLDAVIKRLAYANSNLYVTSKTESSNLPTTAGVFQQNKALNEDAFVMKINTGVVLPPPSLTHQVYLPLVKR
jgi:hypothetical protein